VASSIQTDGDTISQSFFLHILRNNPQKY